MRLQSPSGRIAIGVSLATLLSVGCFSGPVPAPAPERIAFTRVREDVNVPGDYRLEAEIWVMDSDGGNARRLTHNTSDDFGAVWSPDGRTILFGATQFGPDDSGALVVRSAHIYAIDAEGGKPTRITPLDMRAQFPSWSADGNRIVFHGRPATGSAAFEIFTMNPDGTALQQLTANDHVDARPDWSPDGTRIAFQSNRDGSTDIFVMNADGTGVTQLTSSDGPIVNQAPAWSPDGARIVFQSDRAGNAEIHVMNSDGSAQTRITNYAGRDVDPEWSSDGRRIAFDRDVSSNDIDVRQLFVMNADGTNVRALTGLPSSNGHAAWSGQGGRMRR